jgi:hypothetical protein
MCFDDSLLFTGMWRIRYAYVPKVAASCFENVIRYCFELLSRRFNADHLFNTEEEERKLPDLMMLIHGVHIGAHIIRNG